MVLIDPKLVRDFEIVIGLVAPLGTDVAAVEKRIADDLRVYGYFSETLRLSQLLDGKKPKESFKYYPDHMDACDEFRTKLGSGDGLAGLAVSQIVKRRGVTGSRLNRKAWILRTIKHDQEVKLLRHVFGSRFVLVGVHESSDARRKKLTALALDAGIPRKDIDGEISKLVERDQLDEENPFGQRVRDAFELADYFIDLERGLMTESARFVGLLFGQPFLTPTRDESAMFMAHSTSLRSADAGRQVGAVIASSNGEVVATGANEVPRAGGGEYWSGDDPDGRDFVNGFDYNRKQMRRILAETLDVLAADGHLVEGLKKQSSEERLQAVWDKSRPKLKPSRLMSLIEFGRIVHAEMSALMQAARSTSSVQGATLFTTAFPCHMCMRLIVSSGIARVVYVDPYPKSLAFEMYEDSVSEGGTKRNTVVVEAFRGVGAGIFAQLFDGSNRDKEDDGTFVHFDKVTARYRLAEPDPLLAAEALEDLLNVALGKRMRAAGLVGARK